MAPPLTPRPPDKERVNILLVDDQPAKLLSYEAILADLDETLIRASSGSEALECLLRTDVAVVLVDVCMPDVDGFELASMIRQHPRFQKTSIIFVSAIQMTDLDRLRGFECGAVDYVSVPVDPGVLRARVGIFVELFRKTRELERLNHDLELRVRSRTDELERSTEALRVSEERMTLAIQGAGIGTWDANLETGTAFWSRTHFDILGYPPAEDGAATLDMWLRRLHPEDVEGVMTGIERARRDGSFFSRDHRIQRADDGRTVWVTAFGRFVGDGGRGEAKRFVGILFDITERKRLEDALKEADRRKDEFLAVLSHELRNPLAPIRNAVKVLELEGAAGLDWGTSIIDRQVTHLTRLVDDLLDVSRITRGKLQLQLQPIDLKSVVEAAAETFEPSIEQGGHTLSVTLVGRPIQVEGDVVRLTQVFANLLSNAIKSMSTPGSIEIRLQAEGEDAVVTVTDTGCGIVAAELPRLFELFYQPRDLDATSTAGLGIGLTLVRSLVELHGGSVSAASPGPGQGSTFTVCLPRRAAIASVPASDDGADAAPARVTRRVLIADDNADAAETLARLLELDGHETRIAHDGIEAVELAATFQPEVALLDIGMPRLDGYEAARRLREAPDGALVLLVALTGRGHASDRTRAREAGFDVHLTKPVDPRQILEIVASPRPSAPSPSVP